MKYFFLSLLISLLFSCNSSNEKVKDTTDGTIKMFNSIKIENLIDSNSINQISDENCRSLYKDKSKASSSPIKILSISFEPRGNGRVNDLILTYANVSKDDIESVRFVWVAKSLDRTDSVKNKLYDGCGGFGIDSPIKSGNKITEIFHLDQKDLQSFFAIYPTMAEYSNGKKWKID